MNSTQNKNTVAIVDDLRENLETYKEILSEDFNVYFYEDPTIFSSEFTQKQKDIDIVVLDIHMPQENGFSIYKKIRATNKKTPVIFLTGDPSEELLVQGLELGAHDFITKPVSPRALIARIQNKIEMTRSLNSNDNSTTITMGELKVDLEMQQVFLSTQEVPLTPIEFKIIKLLVKSPNTIFSKAELIQKLWPNTVVSSQNIDTHLSNLRKKLSPFSNNIRTVKSKGYFLRV
ncbi:MAG: response regulator transcription factor [Bacteriovoracaceae bacterium]